MDIWVQFKLLINTASDKYLNLLEDLYIYFGDTWIGDVEYVYEAVDALFEVLKDLQCMKYLTFYSLLINMNCMKFYRGTA